MDGRISLRRDSQAVRASKLGPARLGQEGMTQLAAASKVMVKVRMFGVLD